MFRALPLFLILICVPFGVAAKVKITTDGDYRVIRADGLPDHQTGSFPNRSNPHSISSQNYNFRVPLHPKKAVRTTHMQRQPFGVALNGVPFDPGTAECYGQRHGGRPGASCEWREEAIVNGHGKLGLDHSYAHVQPSGAYHYHGIPNGLITGQGVESDLVHVGYAADGFKMVVSRSNAYKPSYRLKTGTRPSGPGGRYDGTYTQDFEYVSGFGALDQCNGMTIHNRYAYIVTKEFPFIPRCWVGTPDSSFARQRGGERGQGRPDHPPHGHRHLPRL